MFRLIVQQPNNDFLAPDFAQRIQQRADCRLETFVARLWSRCITLQEVEIGTGNIGYDYVQLRVQKLRVALEGLNL